MDNDIDHLRAAFRTQAATLPPVGRPAPRYRPRTRPHPALAVAGTALAVTGVALASGAVATGLSAGPAPVASPSGPAEPHFASFSTVLPGQTQAPNGCELDPDLIGGPIAGEPPGPSRLGVVMVARIESACVIHYVYTEPLDPPAGAQQIVVDGRPGWTLISLGGRAVGVNVPLSSTGVFPVPGVSTLDPDSDSTTVAQVVTQDGIPTVDEVLATIRQVMPDWPDGSQAPPRGGSGS